MPWSLKALWFVLPLVSAGQPSLEAISSLALRAPPGPVPPCGGFFGKKECKQNGCSWGLKLRKCLPIKCPNKRKKFQCNKAKGCAWKLSGGKGTCTYESEPTTEPTDCDTCVAMGLKWQVGKCVGQACIVQDVACFQDSTGCARWRTEQHAIETCPQQTTCESCLDASPYCGFDATVNSCFSDTSVLALRYFVVIKDKRFCPAPPSPPPPTYGLSAKRCSAHLGCGSTEYCFSCTTCLVNFGSAACGQCALSNSLGECGPRSVCLQSRDSIDGVCPSGYVGPSGKRCSQHGDCNRATEYCYSCSLCLTAHGSSRCGACATSNQMGECGPRLACPVSFDSIDGVCPTALQYPPLPTPYVAYPTPPYPTPPLRPPSPTPNPYYLPPTRSSGSTDCGGRCGLDSYCTNTNQMPGMPPNYACIPNGVAIGRPYSVMRNGTSVSVVSPLERCGSEEGEPTCTWFEQGEASDDDSMLAGIVVEDRQFLAQEWARAALGEHASVASFARFSLHLMALGAPPGLLHATHMAAAQEVTHAELCLQLAAVYTASSSSSSSPSSSQPGPFPLPPADEEDALSLPWLAASTLLEGCVQETFAAVAAAVRVEGLVGDASPLRATLHTTLTTIANDEASHAALAWRTVQWALTEDPVAVRESVRAALLHAVPHISQRERGTISLSQNGWLTTSEAEKLSVRAMSVIRAWTEALLAGETPPRPAGDDVVAHAFDTVWQNSFM